MRDIMTANPRALDDAQIPIHSRRFYPDRQCLSPRPGGGSACHHVARPAMQRGRPVDLDAAGDPAAGLWRSSVPRRHQYSRPPCSVRPDRRPARWRRAVISILSALAAPTIPSTPAGMSISAFPACIATRTRRAASRPGASTTSRGRSLLLLFLFSDVGEDDARRASGRLACSDGALSGAGRRGGQAAWCWTRWEPIVPLRSHRPAGTVYLCHPFLVHAARAPDAPRFMPAITSSRRALQ